MAIYGIYNSIDEKPIREFSFLDEILETNSCFQDLIDKLDEFEECAEDGEYLNESIVENFKENFHYLITRITKGREEMLKESTNAAREANNYTQELSRITSSDKVKSKRMLLMEKYEIVYQAGNTIVTYTEYKKASMSGLNLDFDAIFKDIKSGNIGAVKKSYKKFRKTAANIYKFIPYVDKETVKGTAVNMAKLLNNAINDAKDLTEKYLKSLNNMANSIKNGANILEQNKSVENIKYVRKYLIQLKRLYTHDLNIIHQNNLRVMRQSRAARDFIKKMNSKSNN